MWDKFTLQRPSLFIKDKPILSSERTLQKGYDCKGSAAKKKKESLVVSLKGLGTKKNCLAVTASHKVTLTLNVAVNYITTVVQLLCGS
jgi:hypothetical protein